MDFNTTIKKRYYFNFSIKYPFKYKVFIAF